MKEWFRDMKDILTGDDIIWIFKLPMVIIWTLLIITKEANDWLRNLWKS